MVMLALSPKKRKNYMKDKDSGQLVEVGKDIDIGLPEIIELIIYNLKPKDLKIMFEYIIKH